VPFEKITVNQLIEACRINRSTFYRNYEDKYDLVRKMCREQLDEFQRALRTDFIALPELGEEETRESFLPLLKYFEKNRSILVILCGHDLPTDLSGDMHRIYSEKILEQMVKHFSIPAARRSMASYYARLISGNILTSILWWHEQQFNASEDEMLEIICTAVSHGVYNSMHDNLGL
jgi:AcrR family transcriptional regulator